MEHFFLGMTTITALGLLIVTYFQLKNSRFQRKNELFDRRYDFYKRVESWWLRTVREDEGPPPDAVDLIPIAAEAELIFGQDIADHIMSLADKRHCGSDFFPDEDFFRPFRKYLKLK